MSTWFWKFLGYLFVALGIVGIVLPGLPTTPFLLLASWAFMKGAPELHEKLLAHPKLGPFLKDWEAGKGIPKRAKVTAITMMWTFLLVSAYFFIPLVAVKILMMLVGIGVTIYLLKLPTSK